MDVDLGNGWKVVGVTSLPVSSSHVSALMCDSVVQSAWSGSTNNLDLIPGRLDTSTVLTTAQPPPAPQWKVVGLTSLSSPIALPTNQLPDSASLLDNFSLLPAGCPVNLSVDAGDRARSMTVPVSTSAATPLSSLAWTSLPDLCAGGSQWKVAGITSLPLPAVPEVTSSLPLTPDLWTNIAMTAGLTPGSCGNEHVVSMCQPVMASPPSPLPQSSMGSSQWKVVGVTCMDSCSGKPTLTFSTPHTPFTPTSPFTPIPAVMAPTSPFVPVPTVADQRWRVVGVVPMTEAECTVPCEQHVAQDLSVHAPALDSATVTPTPVHVRDMPSVSAGGGSLSPPTDVAQTWSAAKLQQPPHKRWLSSSLKLLCNREKDDEDSAHPLAFLKNVSTHFRNAVLKKNTVSTMLKLKRVVQNSGEDERLVRFLGCKKVFTFHNKDHQRLFSAHRRRSHRASLLATPQAEADKRACRTFVDVSDMRLGSGRGAVKVEADGRLRVDEAYSSYVASDIVSPCPNQPSASSQRCSTEEREVGHVLVSVAASADQAVMVKREVEHDVEIGLEAQSVSLATVDPWGLCSDKDLGHIAQMMCKTEQTTVHSTSRKRKLSVPRKMVQ